MTTYKLGHWREWNRWGHEFSWDGKFLGEREVNTYNIDKKCLDDIDYFSKDHWLHPHINKQRVAIKVRSILDTKSFSFISGRKNKKEMSILIEASGCVLTIIKEKEALAKIKTITFPSLKNYSAIIRHLWSESEEQYIIEKAVQKSPTMRLKWLF